MAGPSRSFVEGQCSNIGIMDRSRIIAFWYTTTNIGGSTGYMSGEYGFRAACVTWLRVNLGLETDGLHIVDDVAAEFGERQQIETNRDEPIESTAAAMVQRRHQMLDFAVVADARTGLSRPACPNGRYGEDVTTARA